MKVVITTVGKDRVGIVAQIANTLAAANVNILDINQNIVHGIFNMVVIADMGQASTGLIDLQTKLKDLGASMGLEIKAQNEEIFSAMHRV